jgi:thiamine pyrophosphate-dependent acetolactate synthase large subunit-like protein
MSADARDNAPVRAGSGHGTWGSDALADVLRELGIEYVALNPGSSFRGLHDSLVNHLGNRAPQILLCLHEEHAVSIAHGFAKVSDRAMGVALHSNVGLMHASMALFNAYCDRVPILAIGATGPLDAARRRPWIDWLHTATDQAALVRPFLKWDDQPLSVAAAVVALMHAHRIAMSDPRAPTYVCLDTSIQECELAPDDIASAPRADRFTASAPPAPDAEEITRLARRLERARDVVMLVGRTNRDRGRWQQRIELAERLGARVFTHLKLPAAFPTRHPLHAAPPQGLAAAELKRALREADVILALEWLDLGGTMGLTGAIEGHVAAVSLEDQLDSGWGKESLTPVPADVRLHAHPDAVVEALLGELADRPAPPATGPARPSAPPRGAPGPAGDRGDAIVVADIAEGLRAVAREGPMCLVRVPLSWSGELWDVEDPLDALGGDGGEGVGSGPGMTVGAALALRDTDRLAVSVLGDGDFLMGINALWTAAHNSLPLLIVVANNRSFFNDEVHQHQVALKRDRPVENRWIGQRIAGPDIDLGALARAQGLVAHGPVVARTQLASTLTRATAEARAGAAVVVDVRIESTVEGDEARAAGHVDRG